MSPLLFWGQRSGRHRVPDHCGG